MASVNAPECACFANLWACSHSYYVAISAQLNELNHASLLLRSESLRHLSIASLNRSNTAQKALHKTCTLFLHLSACRLVSLCAATTTAEFDIVNGLSARKRWKILHVRDLLELQVLDSIRDLVLTFCDLPPKSKTSGRANFI